MTATKKKAFPQKLWQLLNDCRLQSALRWSDDGHSFFVYEKELRSRCLGKENNIFFTREPKSFIRQLHLYGFRKLNKNQFKHPNFSRDRPHLIYYIRRSYRQTTASNPPEVTQNLQPTDHVMPYMNPRYSSNDNSNQSDTSDESYLYTSFDSSYHVNYSYYPTAGNMVEVAYENIQQTFTSSSISSLCVCPGCCTQ